MSTTLQYVRDIPAQISPENGVWSVGETRTYEDDKYALAYCEAANMNQETPNLVVVTKAATPPDPPKIEPVKLDVKVDPPKTDPVTPPTDDKGDKQ